MHKKISFITCLVFICSTTLPYLALANLFLPATYYVNDGAREVEERSASGKLQVDYVYGDYIDEVLTLSHPAQIYQTPALLAPDDGGPGLAATPAEETLEPGEAKAAQEEQPSLDKSPVTSDEAIPASPEPPTLVEAIPIATTLYYHYDGLGNVTELTDLNGNIAEKYTYDPYGLPTIKNRTNQVLSNTAVGNYYMFTARRYDPESGLYHYRARAYDHRIGRFEQFDPLGNVDSENLLQYVGNNPVNFVDPYGLYKYETQNVAVAFLHESNPFNSDSAMRQQMNSWGKFYSGDWSGAAAISGQSIVEKSNDPCEGNSGWQNAYTGAQIIGGATLLTAASLIAIEVRTGIRIEVHGTHGGRVLPHLQGIKGPGWGKTLWRYPPH